MSSSDSGLEMLHESEWGVHDWRSCRSLDWFMSMESVGGEEYGTIVVFSINLQHSYDNILFYG
jgi:hypothetical protein